MSDKPQKPDQGDLQQHIQAAHNLLEHQLGPHSSAQYQAVRAEWTAVERARLTGADTGLPTLTIAHAGNETIALITNNKNHTEELIDAGGDVWKSTDGVHFTDKAGQHKLLQPQTGTDHQPPTDTNQPNQTYNFVVEAPRADQRIDHAVNDAITAMHRDTTLGVRWHSPDAETLRRTLLPLNAQETQQFLTQYKQQTGSDLLDELKGRIGDGAQFRTIEALVQRRDGQTNDAGNAMVGLATAKDDPAKGSALLRAAVGSLTAAQFKQMEADFQTRYGTSFEDAIKNNPALSQMDRDLIPFYQKGIENRTADDIKAMAKIVMNQFEADKKTNDFGPATNDYLRAFSDVMGGDTPAAQQARAALRNDKTFADQYNQTFADRSTVSDTSRAVAADLLNEGRISLKTIVEGDKNVLGGLMDNNQNIDLALQKASPQERANYVLGGQIERLKNDPQFRQTEAAWLKTHGTPAQQQQFNQLLQRIDGNKLTQQEQQAVDYHDQLYKAFGTFGNAREQSIWDDEMTNGRKTVVSSLAEAPHEAFLGIFGGGHTTQDLMSRLEHMSSQDYQMLANPVTAAQERDELAKSLKTYADPQEQARLLKLFDQKAEASQKGVSYDESQQIRRSFQDVVADNKTNPQAVVDALQHMSQAEINQFLADPNLRQTVETMIANPAGGNVPLNAAITYLGQDLLSQIEAKHAPATMTAIDKLAGEVIASGGNPPADRVNRLEELYQIMKDPALRTQMQKMEALGDNADLRRANFSASDNALFDLLRDSTPPVDSVSGHGYGETAWRTLLSGEQPVSSEQRQLRDQFIDPARNVLRNIYGNYEAIAALPESVRDQVTARMTDEQRQLLDHVMKNNGQMDLVDRAYSYAIGDGGDARDFRAAFSHMTDAQKKEFSDQFRQRYDKDFSDAFLSRVQNTNPELAEEFRSYVRPKDDGRQTMFEMTGRNAESGGLVLDATGLVAEKSLQDYKAALDKYQALMQKLPPDVQNAMTQYFSEATKQYIDSKKDLNELAKNAVFVAAALASIPLTAGLSAATLSEMIPSLATAAAAGAATNVGIDKLIMGGDANIDFSTYLNGAIAGLLVVAPIPKLPKEAPKPGELPGAAVIPHEPVTPPEPLVPPKPEPLPRPPETVPPAEAPEPVLPPAKPPEPPAEEPLPAPKPPKSPTIEPTEPAAPPPPDKPIKPEKVNPAPTEAELATALRAQLPQIAAKLGAIAAEIGTQPTPTDKPSDAPPTLSPSDALIGLASVRNWEGPYHSANRVLQAVLGRTPTMDEVRALTKAMQEGFKAEHDGHSVTEVGLTHGYQFITPQNFPSLLNQLQGSPELQAKLKAFVANRTAVPANIHSERAFPASAAPHPVRGQYQPAHN